MNSAIKAIFERRLTVIVHSKQGWEYAVEGACEFGFILLETHLPKVSVVAGHIVSEPFDPFHGACKLGKSILMQCFEVIRT